MTTWASVSKELIFGYIDILYSMNLFIIVHGPLLTNTFFSHFRSLRLNPYFPIKSGMYTNFITQN